MNKLDARRKTGVLWAICALVAAVLMVVSSDLSLFYYGLSGAFAWVSTAKSLTRLFPRVFVWG